MSIAYFVYFELPDAAARIAPADLDRVTAVVRDLPRLKQGLVFTPTETKTEHYFPDDPPSPALALQLNFGAIEDLEAALRRDGALQVLGAPDALPSLEGARVTQQAMLRRRFPVDEPRVAPGLSCSYLVHYPGAADDLNVWHAHYIDHHPGIMCKFPGVRAIEIYTRVDWVGFMPWQRVDYMQRNKLVFDDPAALTAALFSPVNAEMRADFGQFPKFTGGNVHYPMLTGEIVPGRASAEL